MSRDIEAFAPAKINLALHVTGQREDGYHLLDSLVAFADHGDTISVRPSDRLSLTIEGPFADGLTADADNLVLRAARLLDPAGRAEITLTKRLPVASGIGGGSADAAATLRALSALWNIPLPDVATAATLGADVPVCLASTFSRMSGVGEQVTPLSPAPQMAILLVNPGVGVSTPEVFKGLTSKDNPAMTAMPPTDGPDWLTWLANQRNDLEARARATAPVISDVLAELTRLPGCRLARMSGSGATCFALFDAIPAAETADLRARHPDWWLAETRLLPTDFLS